jgi:hypothetical protein
MNAKKILVGVVLVGAIGIGAVGAQGGGQGEPGRPGGRGDRGLLRDVFSIVIEATGLDAANLRESLQAGGTLADAITANGGDVVLVTADVMTTLTTRINEAVTNGRITQERADELLANLETRVTDILNGEANLGGIFREREGRGLRGLGDERALIEAVMEATGLTRGTILGQMIDGVTLGEIVTANGGDVDAVTAAALATATERVNEAVANGRITQEQADQLLARLSEYYTKAMNGTVLPGRRGAGDGVV